MEKIYHADTIKVSWNGFITTSQSKLQNKEYYQAQRRTFYIIKGQFIKNLNDIYKTVHLVTAEYKFFSACSWNIWHVNSRP